MTTLAIGEYRPDLSDLDGTFTRSLRNVKPRADGYGPLRALAPWTRALGSRCRGGFYARKSDGSVAIFAATDVRLYMLDNTTFALTDVSQGASDYSGVNDGEHWQFAQFNDYVIAVQANTAPQVFTLSSSSAFEDLDGTPPQARYIAIVNRFAVLFGLTDNFNRVQWSGLNDVNSADAWTSGINASDFQDLPDGGMARGIQGGDLGFILQDAAIRRMTFQPGSDVIFSIDKVAKDVGVIAPNATVNVGSVLYFIAAPGFMRLDAQGNLTPIGEEKINRTFLATADLSAPEFILGAADPNSNIIMWCWRTAGVTDSKFDAGVLYNVAIDRFAPHSYQGEYITSIATPGLTLEALDAIAPGAQLITGAASNGGPNLIRIQVASTSGWTTGDYKTISGVTGTTEANATWPITVINSTHIDLQGSVFVHAYVSGGVVGGSLDLLPFSLDAVALSTLPNLSIVGTDHKIGYLTGDTVEATLETPEQSGDGQRMLVDSFAVLTDATAAYGSLGVRENQNAAFTYTGETAMDDRGVCSQLWSTRYARGRVRIPAGTPWTYCKGIRPDAQPDGID